MGGGVGRWPMEGGQGGRWGGGTREQCGATKTGSTTGLIWLVTRVGGSGGGVGRWPMEGGQGDGVGALKSIVGATKSLKNPTTGLIWLVTRVGGWGVGRWPMEGGQGGRWGGGTRLAGDDGRGMGGGVGWPMEGEIGGGHQRAVWEQQKCTVP